MHNLSEPIPAPNLPQGFKMRSIAGPHEAADGSIAANCICSVNELSKIGNTDPIAAHPHYQRLGLARALSLTGLGYLKGRGMFFAQIGTSSDNIAMQRTAKSVGLR